jgi:hypothetical protein
MNTFTISKNLQEYINKTMNKSIQRIRENNIRDKIKLYNSNQVKSSGLIRKVSFNNESFGENRIKRGDEYLYYGFLGINVAHFIVYMIHSIYKK